jgi:hypothetical protein
MQYTLRGKIARAHPYQLDTTLTMEGAGAESKAVGEAIAAAKKIAEDHKKETSNPHKVTKEQVGLSNVDNTADMEKPISVAQAGAIADAKKTGTDAMAEAKKKTEKLSRIATLSATGWVENAQTVDVDGVTENNTVIICANPANATEYLESAVRCTNQTEGKLTFTCEEVPSIDLLVNVLILI